MTCQAYVLMMVLASTADEHAVVWRGLLLIFVLFLVNIFAAACFVAGNTIGQITGMFRSAFVT